MCGMAKPTKERHQSLAAVTTTLIHEAHRQEDRGPEIYPKPFEEAPCYRSQRAGRPTSTATEGFDSRTDTPPLACLKRYTVTHAWPPEALCEAI
jgi:hypothetical protein